MRNGSKFEPKESAGFELLARPILAAARMLRGCRARDHTHLEEALLEMMLMMRCLSRFQRRGTQRDERNRTRGHQSLAC